MTSIPTGEEYYRGRRDTVGQLFEAIDGDEYALRGTNGEPWSLTVNSGFNSWNYEGGE